MQEIEYRGCKLQAKSYQSDNTGKWVPYAVVLTVDATPNNKEVPLTWDREFETEREANNFALESAQFYVDENF